MFPFTSTLRQYGGFRLRVQSRRGHHCKGLPLNQKGTQINFTCKHCRGPGSISRPSDYEIIVLTSRPERCAVSHKSATGICRNTRQLNCQISFRQNRSHFKDMNPAPTYFITCFSLLTFSSPLGPSLKHITFIGAHHSKN